MKTIETIESTTERFIFSRAFQNCKQLSETTHDATPHPVKVNVVFKYAPKRLELLLYPTKISQLT